MAPKATPIKKQAAEDPRHTQAVKDYEVGVRALQERKFEKAKTSLQKVLAGPNKSLVDRAQVYIASCEQHLETPVLHFKTSEEHFDYTISLMNTGDYVTAREHFDKLLKQEAKTDYVLYGLAALHCLTGHVEDALKTLSEAIEANPALRFQARNDADFQNLAEDPRFTELLYPDPGVDESAALKEESPAY
ncbi:MAG: tetratricopeptide repeat protein [Terriglobales bacterium]|jgi:tetratricopeptide (TPR) repeat protein